MNIYTLHAKHLEKHPGSHFFDSETLKFFGETLSGMTVLKKTAIIKDYLGTEHECYVISATRNKNAFGHCKPYKKYHYFDINTLEDVYGG